MPLAFLLWDHDSYGPERLVVTLDPDALPDLALSFNDPAREPWVTPEHIAVLKAVIPRLRRGPDIQPLMDGWGGLHVQSVELDALAHIGCPPVQIPDPVPVEPPPAFRGMAFVGSPGLDADGWKRFNSWQDKLYEAGK